MFWNKIGKIYKKKSPEKFDKMMEDMNGESLDILNNSISKIKTGLSLYEERDQRIIIGQMLNQLGYFKEPTLIDVGSVLEFMGYDGPTGTWDKDIKKKPISIEDLDYILNSKYR
jgi:hypothetical protein